MGLPQLNTQRGLGAEWAGGVGGGVGGGFGGGGGRDRVALRPQKGGGLLGTGTVGGGGGRGGKGTKE